MKKQRSESDFENDEKRKARGSRRSKINKYHRPGNVIFNKLKYEDLKSTYRIIKKIMKECQNRYDDSGYQYNKQIII